MIRLSDVFDHEFAGRVGGDADDFVDDPTGWRALDGNDDVYRFGDELRGWRNARFLDELPNAYEGGAGVVGVDGADADRVAGVPGFEQCKSAAVAHLAHHDPIRA